MRNVAGVMTQTDTSGNLIYVTIDVNKHKEIITPVLEQLGVLDKSQFMKDFEAGVSIEDSRKRAHAKIDSLWSK